MTTQDTRTSDFISCLKANITPVPFDRIIESEFDLLATRASALPFGARYALAVAPWPADTDFIKTMTTFRSSVEKALGAMWLFREVGLHLILYGSKESWAQAANTLRADVTGLHSVIVQAIHFVDLALEEEYLIRSQWGPVSFGGGVDVGILIRESLHRKKREEIPRTGTGCYRSN